MRVLVVGGGGREHAIVWKLAQSPKVDKLYCAPGNAGIAQDAECVNIKAEDIEGLCTFAKEHQVDLAVIGPEVPLAMGIVDEMAAAGIRAFGPDKSCARLEASTPVRNSSTTILSPALPNTRSPIISSMAFFASSSVSAITTPFPAARPSAFRTIG